MKISDILNAEKIVLKDEVPEWHKKTVTERIEKYDNNPDSWLDFELTMNNIDKID